MINAEKAKIPVVVIFAPTATGKTALALNLFGKSSFSFFKGKGELISADSMQVYKKLDIGTAKPTKEEKSLLEHHLIDICSYETQFNVADFINEADKLCKEIWSRKKIPVIAGGTGFYIRSFLLGLPQTPESNENVRNQLKKECNENGAEFMYEQLKRIDPQSAKKIDKNDVYRILRALEVFRLTGKTRSSFALETKLRDSYDFCTIILERNREELFERINNRVDKMFELGLKTEVENLIKNGAKSTMPGMQAIGYKEWFEIDFSTQEGIELIRKKIQKNSRKYAKKQYTYMKDIPNAASIHIDSDDEKELVRKVEKVLLEKLSIFY